MPYMKSHSLSATNDLGPATRDHRGGEALGVGRLHGVERTFAETAVDAQARSSADLQVDVRRSLFDREVQQSVQIQHDASNLRIGVRPGLL